MNGNVEVITTKVNNEVVLEEKVGRIKERNWRKIWKPLIGIKIYLLFRLIRHTRSREKVTLLFVKLYLRLSRMIVLQIKGKGSFTNIKRIEGKINTKQEIGNQSLLSPTIRQLDRFP